MIIRPGSAAAKWNCLQLLEAQLAELDRNHAKTGDRQAPWGVGPPELLRAAGLPRQPRAELVRVIHRLLRARLKIGAGRPMAKPPAIPLLCTLGFEDKAPEEVVTPLMEKILVRICHAAGVAAAANVEAWLRRKVHQRIRAEIRQAASGVEPWKSLERLPQVDVVFPKELTPAPWYGSVFRLRVKFNWLSRVLPYGVVRQGRLVLDRGGSEIVTAEPISIDNMRARKTALP